MRCFIFSLILLNLFSVATPAAEKRNQLEELLIWKMSDELKLTTAEEKKFTEILKNLNDEKTTLNHSLQTSIENMVKATSSKLKEAELSHYKKLLQSYGRLSEQEIDRLKPLLGTEKLIQYLSIKQELTNKIKSLLSAESGNKGVKPLPSPRLIEEK